MIEVLGRLDCSTEFGDKTYKNLGELLKESNAIGMDEYSSSKLYVVSLKDDNLVVIEHD